MPLGTPDPTEAAYLSRLAKGFLESTELSFEDRYRAMVADARIILAEK